MPWICPLIITVPTRASATLTSTAVHRATIELSRTISGGNGDRYTSTSTTSTEATATSSSSPSMPANAADRSALNTAGPVICACRPSGSSASSTARSASTASAGAAPSGGRTISCTACPSSDGTCGLTSVAVVPVAPTAVSTADASRSTRALNAPGSTCSPSVSTVTTTIAGAVPESWKSSGRSLTFVDSADSGRNEDRSLVATSLICPKVGPPTAATASQSRISDTESARSRSGRRVCADSGMMHSIRLRSR